MDGELTDTSGYVEQDDYAVLEHAESFPTESVPFRQQLPFYQRNSGAEVEAMRALEAHEAFSWTPPSTELQPDLVRSGYLGPATAAQRWIYDHNPKSGGTEFAVECERRLYDQDHLRVRWPNSWMGTLLGRLEQAAVVHGHGARHALRLLPHASWRMATTVREPLSSSISNYQQAMRMQALQGQPVPLSVWIAQFEREGRDLNRQVRWFSRDRIPSLEHSQGVLRGPSEPREMLARASYRLSTYDVIGTPITVRSVFAHVARSAALRVRPPDHDQPPANRSEVPSAELLDSLPYPSRDLLSRLTALDQVLYERACDHPGFL